MIVITSWRYRAWTNGSRIKTVTCERCSQAFAYRLTRTGFGAIKQTSTPMHAEGNAIASGLAKQQLDKRLASDSETVPCPKCNWVNQELIDAYRRRRYRRAIWFALASVILGLLIAMQGEVDLDWRFTPRSMPTQMVIGVTVFMLCIFIPAAIFLLRFTARARFNPNATFPQPPALPEGTPPALISHRDPATGKSHWALPRSKKNPEPALGDWAVLRHGSYALPKPCCRCMGGEAQPYRAQFQYSKILKIKLPLCYPCRDRVEGAWWGVTIVGGAVALAVGLTIQLMPYIDESFRWLVALASGAIVLIVAMIIASISTRPFTQIDVDRDRGIFKVRAVNPEYTAALIKAQRRLDGFQE